MLILLGNSRVNRAAEGKLTFSDMRSTRETWYNRQGGLQNTRVFPGKMQCRPGIFRCVILDDFMSILHGKTRCCYILARILLRRNAYLGRSGVDFGVHFGPHFGTW